MKKVTSHILTAVTVLTTFAAAPVANAGNLVERCNQDQLSASQAPGRNAWALRWGLITQAQHDGANMMGMYWVFNKGSYYYGVAGSTSNPKVWIAQSSDNVAAGTYLSAVGACVPGCYTPEQQILTDEGLVGIEQAYERDIKSVIALTEDSSLGQLEFAPQTIDSFVAGETEELIYVLEGSDGQRLEVTAEHPMVLSSGEIVEAWTLEPGDHLLGEHGETIVLRNIDTFMFEGTVWNLRPQTEVKQENVLVAEGFLTGSHRFQYEWADEVNKLLRRDSIELPSRELAQ